MRAGKCYTLQSDIGIDLCRQHIGARHEMTRSRGFGAEREILALQIGQRIDRSIPSNEHRAEFLVFFTLHNWNHLAAATYISLNESKAAELHQIELVVQQPPPTAAA